MRRIRYAFAGFLAAAAGQAADVPAAAVTVQPPINEPYVAPAGVVLNYVPADLVAVGDVTGDGLNDIVASSQQLTRITILPGTGDGGVGAATVIPTKGAAGSRLFLRQLNDDGAGDIVVDENGTPRVHVRLSDGAGGFVETVYGPAGDFRGAAPRDTAIADWDGDGDLDIVQADGDLTAGRICVRLNLGQGRFATTEEQYPIPAFVANVQFGAVQTGRLVAIVAADLDGDGDVDIAGTPAGAATIEILLRDADGVLIAQPPLRSQDAAGRQWFAFRPSVADVDGDGLADLVVPGRNRAGTTVGVLVYRHATESKFAAADLYTTGGFVGGSDNSHLDVADLNGDGRPDIVSCRAVLVNAGDGTFTRAQAPSTLAPYGMVWCVTAGNMDGDPHPDVVRFGGSYQGASVFPVRSGGPAPIPEVERIATGPVTIGTTADVVVLGSGFLPGITAHFGADVTVNEVDRESDKKVRVNVTVLRTAFPGANGATLANPGSSPAAFEFPVILGGTATVTGVVPSQAHAGETLDVVVHGSGSAEGAAAALGEGVTVTSVDALEDGGFQMTVALGLTAPVGPHDLTIDNGSGVRTVAPDAFTVLPRKSLDITPAQGVMTTHPRPGRGSFSVRGRIAFFTAMSDGVYEPATETTRVAFGHANLPSVVEIAPGAGWRMRGKRATWKSGRHSRDDVTVEVDLRRGTFRIDARNVTLLPQSGTQVVVEATLGDETGVSVRRWSRQRGSRGRVLVLK